MVERPIPQDILKYKQKAIKNLSAREVICAFIGVICIVIGFFYLFKGIEDVGNRALISSVLGIPAFVIGFVKLYGVPFEKIIVPIVVDNVINPAKRTKEIHEPELEKFEKSRYWIREAGVKDPKKIKKMMQPKASKKYPAIK